jgi:hypothetical protein
MICYRASLQNLSGQVLQPATPNLRTLVGFGLSSISLPKLRFLRVLHVADSDLKNFSLAIGGCIHLRCLRLTRCENVTLSSSIGKLLYLQIIDLRKNKIGLSDTKLSLGYPYSTTYLPEQWIFFTKECATKRSADLMVDFCINWY